MHQNYKIVVFVPLTHTDIVREAMGKAGAGKLGNYSYASFSSRGVGRFKPEEGAHPAIGSIGKLEEVDEERIEVVCSADLLNVVIAAIKEVHPYEEVALDVYPIETL
jgi:hypothetical protein